MAPALPIQAPPTQAPPVQTTSVPAPLIQAPPVEEPFPTQVLLAQVSLAQIPPAQVPPTQVPLTSIPLAPLATVENGLAQPGKHPEQVKVVYTASGQKKIPGLLEKGRPVVQVYNDNEKYPVLTQSPTIQQTYVQSISDPSRDFYIRPSPKDFYIRPPREPISQLGVSSDSIVKVINPLLDVPEASTT